MNLYHPYIVCGFRSLLWASKRNYSAVYGSVAQPYNLSNNFFSTSSAVLCQAALLLFSVGDNISVIYVKITAKCFKIVSEAILLEEQYGFKLV